MRILSAMRGFFSRRPKQEQGALKVGNTAKKTDAEFKRCLADLDGATMRGKKSRVYSQCTRLELLQFLSGEGSSVDSQCTQLELLHFLL